MKRAKREAMEKYLAWAYADPKYREFTDSLVKEYLETGVKPDVKQRFSEYYDGRPVS